MRSDATADPSLVVRQLTRAEYDSAVAAPTIQRHSCERGAYGFRLLGLPGTQALLVEAPPGWPPLEVEIAPEAPGPPYDRVGPERAELCLQTGGWVGIDRAPGRAVYYLSRPVEPAAVVHPYLAPVALIAARWLGRESFHAGAFVADGGVWALLGDKEAGKSTTLAALAAEGVPVVCDDALVLDAATALAGPRLINLRAEAARRLGMGEPLGTVGVRERWRIPLAAVEPELPFRGWVTLEWADRVAVEPIRGAARLPALMPHRGVRIEPVRPAALVDYAALPHLRLRRPRAWGSLRDGVHRLLDAIAGRGS
jgi:hypothetical protein